jgi:hypothetical protein
MWPYYTLKFLMSTADFQGSLAYTRDQEAREHDKLPSPTKQGVRQSTLRRSELALRLTMEGKLTLIVDQEVKGGLESLCMEF